ncbi:hypothetical protein ACFP3I_06220 [Chryseobacterium arachidis]
MQKKDDYIDLLVKFDHPDAGPFPEDKNFALQLLLHEAYGYARDFTTFPTCPLGHAIPHEKFLPEDLVELVDTYIKDTIIYETQNLPWDEDEAHEKMNALCEKDGLQESDDNWRSAWDTHWRAFWKDYTRIPWAIYRITTTDPKWTEHLKTYQEFDSAGFSEGENYVNENIKIDVPNPSNISDYVIYRKPESSRTALSSAQKEKTNNKPPVLKKLLVDLWKAMTNTSNSN